MKKLAKVVTAGIFSLLLSFGFSQVAFGHDRLVESTPAAEAVLSESPTEIVLRFSATPMEEGKAVLVTGTDGTEWATGVITSVDNSIIAELSGPLPTDVYSVKWRVASSDSHVISDEYFFTVQLPGETAPEAPGNNGAEAGDTEDGLNIWIYVIGIAGTIILVGAIALIIRRATQK